MPEYKSYTHVDVIVIGVGSMGAAACYYLAKQGHRVLGLEQFTISHEQGSHTGQSRIIRKAYFEDPGYVPLLNRAYENWKTFEKETGTKLYYRTGLIYAGKPDNILIKGVKESASLYNIPLETPGNDISKRFPQFNIPSYYETLFEPDAGFITPEKAITLYTKQAISHGAEIHTNEKVIAWKKDGKNMVIATDRHIYRCDKLIITAGAWAGKLIPGANNIISVTRQVIAWVKPKQQENYILNNFPCWMIADEDKPGTYYGFPVLPVETFDGPHGLKLALHYPGEINDPDNVNRQTTTQELKHLENFLHTYLPGAFDSILTVKTCLYANTPDENFIIDKLPGYEDQVVIACGFSGHGFKFVSVVGEIIADLVIKGKTTMPVEFLNAKRFIENDSI